MKIRLVTRLFPVAGLAFLLAATVGRADTFRPAETGDKTPVELGSRLELFVDDFLIDGMAGGIERRLHHPVRREVIMEFGEQGKPWETSIGYPTVVQDGERILLYYSGRFSIGQRADGTDIIRFELCNLEGASLEGFALADSEELYGNEVEHTVAWRSGADVARLAGQPVRLRIRLRDADLYSICLAP